jgi:hypothetical protein
MTSSPKKKHTCLLGGSPRKRPPKKIILSGRTPSQKVSSPRKDAPQAYYPLQVWAGLQCSYTMLAFHQCGFSSGWEDRIPLPVEQSGSSWWEGAAQGWGYIPAIVSTWPQQGTWAVDWPEPGLL